MLLSAVLFSQMIVQDFKNQILTHDYKIVGYMLEHGASPSDVSSALAAEESDQLISTGKSFLQIQGYKENMTSRLLPGANELFIRYRLIFNISHQLKTPLAALKMYNEIMQDECENEETVKKFTVKTENTIERIEILIQNLLKIAKIDAGTIILNKKDENIKALLNKIASGFEIRAEREQKTITLSGSGDVTLYWDGDWMTEAIGNLIKNALDHMGSGGWVEITWRRLYRSPTKMQTHIST